MSKGNTFENDLLKLIFNAVAIADIAQDDASSPLTFLEVSLHTATPNEGGAQNTSEAAYTNYARVAVSRDTDGWTVVGNSVSPAEIVEFPEAGAGSNETLTHWAVGTAHTGAGKVLYYGALTPNIVVLPNVTPRLKTTSAITED